MTPTQINQTIYDWVGDKKFLLLKRGLYWRPNAHGYTHNLSEAGRYSREEAERFCNGSQGEVTFEPEPVPDYAGDLNVVHRLAVSRSIEWQATVSHRLMDHIESDQPYVLTRFVNSSALQRAEAIVKVIQSK